MYLSQTETEILNLLTNEFMTVNQIAISRHCSIQAVYKTVRNLRKKGAFTRGLIKVEKLGVGIKPSTQNQIRIHNQQWDIKIIHKSNKYEKTLKNCSQLDLNNNTVMLYENKVEIYSNQSFYGNDIRQSLTKSMAYWDNFLAKLEHNISCILKKPRSQNIRLCRAHYAETSNEISKEIDNKGDRWLQIYTTNDGKLWFLIDNSFNLHEAETVHSKTAKQDMEKVKDVFNDLRDNQSYLPSDTKLMIDGLVKASANLTQVSIKIEEKVATTLNLIEIMTRSTTALAQNIESHIPTWASNLDTQKEIKKLIKLISTKQKKIGDYL